jgi:hypothetical protein
MPLLPLRSIKELSVPLGKVMVPGLFPGYRYLNLGNEGWNLGFFCFTPRDSHAGRLSKSLVMTV